MYKKIFVGFTMPLFLFAMVEIYLRTFSENKVTIAKEQDAIPAVGPLLYIKEKFPATIMPLSGISMQKTVLCKEDSGWALYQSDRFGFPNPDKIWEESQIDLAFIGDSYVQGACVPQGNSFVDRMRKQAKVLNLSSFGHGPISQLGLILEYLVNYKPKKVVVTYVPNDINTDMLLEMSHPKLAKYLHYETQHLMEKQQLIDEEYKAFLHKHTNNAFEENSSTLKVLQLWQKWNLKITKQEPDWAGYNTDHQLSLGSNLQSKYLTILLKMQEVVHAWGGEFIVLFIPDATVFKKSEEQQVNTYYNSLQKQMMEFNITFLDFRGRLTQKENPFEYYAPQIGFYGHFNVLGHEEMYKYLLEKFQFN